MTQKLAFNTYILILTSVHFEKNQKVNTRKLITQWNDINGDNYYFKTLNKNAL